MKCPHCNQEHPDGFQFCPATGKKLGQLKACTLNPECPDHGKHILPLDSLFCPTCGYKLEDNTHNMDSEDEESFDNEYDDIPCCPECGSDDVTDDGSDFLQYKCNDCGREWGDRDDRECPECGSYNIIDDGSNYLQYKCKDCDHAWGDEDENDDDDELHKFFPVIGIILGETTIEEAEEQDYMYDKIEYMDSDGDESDYYDEDGISIVWYEGMQFRKEKDDYAITNIYMTCYHPMFSEWEDLGFDWEMSYYEWKSLFREMGFSVEILEEPHKNYSENIGHSYLEAVFIADAPDDSIRFKLHFGYGDSGYSQSSKKTLYSINVYSRNSSHWD